MLVQKPLSYLTLDQSFTDDNRLEFDVPVPLTGMLSLGVDGLPDYIRRTVLGDKGEFEDLVYRVSGHKSGSWDPKKKILIPGFVVLRISARVILNARPQFVDFEIKKSIPDLPDIFADEPTNTALSEGLSNQARIEKSQGCIRIFNGEG